MTIKAVKRLKRKITVENLWIYILKIIMDHGEIRGYDARKYLREEYGIKVPAITTYTVIYRMEREGLIKKIGNGDKYYKITEKGYEAFKQGINIIKESLSKLDPSHSIREKTSSPDQSMDETNHSPSTPLNNTS
ncbi:PadR family transcriptional regulator [Staphylothermus hellenicus]|uniref:Transcriptional regulator, PadR-like family n=1 Tax=Staphylothermus hellenicus (strain DSM 12710 / JCM 10830 / BK20S6-10-b1 / P8) TaxID=591019 RepID=D7DBV2_STAHD|nr:PadR family transcriptional regulator [Staphylothermus hellenicus]ADI31649.1 transcriptional regulator, PadR-like family [Staphylothermus hellenicus DSM 12710]